MDRQQRKEWLLIGLAFLVFAPAITVFAIVSGWWRLALGLWVATVVCGFVAWRAGLPLHPGRVPRSDEDRRTP